MALMINGVRVDDPSRIYVIAEISGNHGQDYVQAQALVRAAAEAGADAVKVQTFTPEEICADIPLPFGHDAKHDEWLKQLGVTRMRELFSRGGFPREWHIPLKKFAESCGVELLSTPFSVDAAKFLVEEVGMRAIKIASGDFTYQLLLDYAARWTDLPLIVSTGGATLNECYAQATTNYVLYPALEAGRLVLMHCVSTYPCPNEWANVAAIRTMRERFAHLQHIPPLILGWSDHTLSVDLVPALAVACGATVIEKHIRLEGDETSVDVAHSLTPSQFAMMVETLREVPSILGTGIKSPHPSELHDRLWARRDPSDWLRPTQAARKGLWA